MLKTYADVVHWLEQQRVPHTRDEARQSVILPVGALGPGMGLILGWNERLGLAQLLLPLELTASTERRAEILEGLGRANHALAMPGLSLEPQGGAIFYRLVVLFRRPEAGLSEEDVQGAMRTCVQTVHDFLSPLRELVTGDLSAEDLLARASALREEARARSLG